MPGLKAINLHFGSWRNALSKIDVGQLNHIMSRKFVISKDGHLCDSIEESMVDDWLFDNDIKHIVHRQYPDSKMNMDFYLPDHNIILEYAGLYFVDRLDNNKRRDTYRNKLQSKEEIAEKIGAGFIIIKPNDLKHIGDVIGIR